MLGIDRIAKKLFVSQEGVHSVDFVSLPHHTVWR